MTSTPVFKAPWSTGLKVVSLGVGLTLSGGLLASLVLPARPLLGGFQWFALVLALVVLVGCALFTIRGYSLSHDRLLVQRLMWSTRIPLSSLVGAWPDSSAMARSIRLLGNAGVFSVTGVFFNRKLGRYHALVTDPARAVVLELPTRKIVVTPDSPSRFLKELQARFPSAKISLGAD